MRKKRNWIEQRRHDATQRENRIYPLVKRRALGYEDAGSVRLKIRWVRYGMVRTTPLERAIKKTGVKQHARQVKYRLKYPNWAVIQAITRRSQCKPRNTETS